MSSVNLFKPVKTTFINPISIARGKYTSGSVKSEYTTVHPHEIKKKFIEIKKSERLWNIYPVSYKLISLSPYIWLIEWNMVCKKAEIKKKKIPITKTKYKQSNYLFLVLD